MAELVGSGAEDILDVDARLQRFESLTDAALAYLNTQDLLAELLDWVRESLLVDVAAVMTLDESGSHLLATLARGIETEVRRGLRVRLGHGFSGRVASQLRPLTVQRSDLEDGIDPELRDRGVRSLLGVPLVANGTTVGVLSVGTFHERRFDDEEIELLQKVGDRMALAIEATSDVAERSAVGALQRSLVPSFIPPVPGLSVAARYVPGEGRAVGGDWYDVFTLPNGQVCAAIGDVVGHGLRAAVVMGRIRSALRAYAYDGGSAGDILVRVHRKMRHFEPGEMATVLLAIFDASLARMQWSSAGHLPPMLAVPGEASLQVEVPPDPPLGAPFDVARRTTTLDMPPGGVLCLYTDGLVERRGAPLDDYLTLLRETLDAEDPEVVCASIMSDLVGGAEPTDDDIALVVVRRDPPEVHNTVTVPAVSASLMQIRLAMRRWLGSAGVTPSDTNDLVLAVGEAATNVVEHAYGAAGGSITVDVSLGSHEAVATVRDTGRWRPARGTHRGRGMPLMEACSDKVSIERPDTGTTVTIRRQLQRSGQP